MNVPPAPAPSSPGVFAGVTEPWPNATTAATRDVEEVSTHSPPHRTNTAPVDLDDAPPSCARRSESQLPALPGQYLLRHRMGFSVACLGGHRGRHRTRHEVEELLLYKEQKYNAINTLSRFCMLVILVLCFAVVGQVFSASSTSWAVVRRGGEYNTTGLFAACRGSLVAPCQHRTRTGRSITLVDVTTAHVVCRVDDAAVRRDVAAMWTVGIVQLVCELGVVGVVGYLAQRPTRTGAMKALLWLLALSVCGGIVNSVLFARFSRCERMTCTALHASAPWCEAHYGWAYKLYIAAVALTTVCWVLTLCMYSYVLNLHTTVAAQLCLARQRQHEALQHTARHSPTASCGVPRADSHVEFTPFEPHTVHDACDDAATLRQNATHGTAPDDDVVTQEPIATHTVVPRTLSRDDAAPRSRQSRTPLDSFAVTRAPSGVTIPHPTPAATEAAVVRNLGDVTSMQLDETRNRAAVPRVHTVAKTDSCRTRAVAPPPLQPITLPSLLPTAATSSHDPVVPSSTLTPHTSGTILRRARRARSYLMRIFSRDFDPSYLTATELGVRIAGANDWVYDDRSDLFYSFALDTFWDPLWEEYYNNTLKTWQKHINEVVDARRISE